MTTETSSARDVHTCSYECERPACIRARRDELRASLEALAAEGEICESDLRGVAVTQAGEVDGEALARRFHETYERLAPSFGYETRTETREFDPESANGRLMIAVCAELSQQPDARGVVDESLRRDADRWRKMMTHCKRDYIWYHVLTDEQKEGHESLESAVDALTGECNA